MNTDNHQTEAQTYKETQNICKFYINGSYWHGEKGPNCKFSHSKKLLIKMWGNLPRQDKQERRKEKPENLDQ